MPVNRETKSKFGEVFSDIHGIDGTCSHHDLLLERFNCIFQQTFGWQICDTSCFGIFATRLNGGSEFRTFWTNLPPC